MKSTELIAFAVPDDDLQIVGTASGLRSLIRGLEEKGGRLVLPCRPAQQAREHSVSAVEVISSEDFDAVIVADAAEQKRIIIEGPAEKLRILAANVRFLLSNQSPDASQHMHVEYFPDHFYLSERTVPLEIHLVASVRDLEKA